MHLYQEKPRSYYSNTRDEISKVFPISTVTNLKALEIGCGAGHTLHWLKASGTCSWVAGVDPYCDIDPSIDDIDLFEKCNIEKELPNIHFDSLDMILCLDVLEHLVDPWTTLSKLNKLLKHGGYWIISVPNMQNYRTVFRLLFKGDFEYTEAGIFDRTHLRFFTKKTLCQMISNNGAEIVAITDSQPVRWHKKILSRLGAEDLLAKQWILAARKI